MAEAKPATGEQEPSMEEILQSIRSIIAEEDKPANDSGSDILELTEMVEEPTPMPEPVDVLASIDDMMAAATPAPVIAEAPPPPPPAAPVAAAPAVASPSPQPTAPAPTPANQLLSQQAATAAASTLHRFAQSLEKPIAGITPSANFRGGYTVEDLMIETLKPMLKEWLDANLPVIVERIVEREVKKLTS